MVDRPDRPEQIRTFCRICGAHCGVIVQVVDGQPTKVVGDAADPVSNGYTCPKGRMMGQMHVHPRRLDIPQLGVGESRRAVSWDVLLDDMSLRLKAITDTNGADSIATYTGTANAFDGASRVVTPLLGAALGTRSRYTALTIDCASKTLISDLMAGVTGLVAVPDYDAVELLIYIGSNPVVSHGSYHFVSNPVVRLRQVMRRGEVWVLDVRRTETARLATRHLAPRPGSDYAVLAYLIRALLRQGADRPYLDRHSVGVETLTGVVERYDIETTSAVTGLPADDLEQLLVAVRKYKRVAIQTGTGISMSANANVIEWMAWSLQIVRGSMDRPGGTWFNPGFLSKIPPPLAPAKPAERGPASRPNLPRRWDQFPVAALVDEIEAGNVSALLVLGGSPLTAFPDARKVRRALEQLEVLALSGRSLRPSSPLLPRMCSPPQHNSNAPI